MWGRHRRTPAPPRIAGETGVLRSGRHDIYGHCWTATLAEMRRRVSRRSHEADESLAGAEVGAGIERTVLAANLEVQVRAGRAAGRADLGDRRAADDALALLGKEGGEMGIAGDEAIAM